MDQLDKIVRDLEGAASRGVEEEGAELGKRLGGLLIPIAVAIAAGLLVYLIGLRQ